METAAVRYDAQNASLATRARSTRQTHVHDLDCRDYDPLALMSNAHDAKYRDHGDAFYASHEDSMSPDAIHADYDVFNTSQDRNPNRPWVPKELFALFPPELRTAWTAFDWNKAPANASIRQRQQQRAQLHDVVPDPNSMSDKSLAQQAIYQMVQTAIADLASSTLPDTSRGDVPEPDPSSTPSPLLAHLTQQQPAISDGNLQQLIAQAARKRPPNPKPDPKRPTSYVAKLHNVQYNVTLGNQDRSQHSLMDRGANGGYAGADCRLLAQHSPPRYADVTGIGDHTITNLQIGTYAGVVDSQHGPIVLIMHQYAGYGKGKSIHAAGQWEHYGHTVDDKSKTVGGKQRVTTRDGYVIPIQIRNGLPHIAMHPPTNDELSDLPNVLVTSDLPWDPHILDCEQTIDDLDNLPPVNPYGVDHPFDRKGRFRPTEVYSHDIGDGLYVELDMREAQFEHFVDVSINEASSEHVPPLPGEPDDDPVTKTRATDITVRGKAIELNSLRPYFLWSPTSVILPDDRENDSVWSYHAGSSPVQSEVQIVRSRCEYRTSKQTCVC